MPRLYQLESYHSERGDLTVIENILPSGIKRVYYITGVPEGVVRGGHRHHKTWQALVCLKGQCEVYVQTATEAKTYVLNSPDKCLFLSPQDWHTMYNFTEDALLLVLANENYDVGDYIDEPYFSPS